ncbi:Nucleotide-binding universal stress protein, UspA family [Micromonospora phaseoli]|uniref:Nucleotide-binding universal stress protein, UspA family n=1 Tax=Micromonospora phaseoli TaxID=1144548 RepID=A0A1H6TWS8_9ACTN|nr:universal stress protein [Micromonospora phaseoli]PZV98779.1 nucleotide-binding universal stress UspA family protein [Micromonospora phaseoli]GIJ76471.1 universal stress protein [Micromonospora phaseoli]SEI84503.1 Nucleotide-binding universal stress protein, UspA family [Micromonospora phaseoli]
MNSASGTAVVVGVDGSEPALAAVRLAAAEAARRQRPLRVVHAFIWPLVHSPIRPTTEGAPGGGLRTQAEQLVADAVDEAETIAPGLRVTGEIIDGEPTALLLDEAPSAELIVIGDRGLGGFTALVVGSVAVKLAAYADCPVLVARGAQRPDGPVVVGVDGSELSRHAVEFAVRTAALRGAGVTALHAYRHPVSNGPGDMQPLVYDESELRAEEDRTVAEAIAGLTERYPEVPITRQSVRGRAAKVLTEASQRAQLLVVGGQGRGELTGLLLGSVSQSLLHHSRCPVAVVRPPRAAAGGVGDGAGG